MAAPVFYIKIRPGRSRSARKRRIQAWITAVCRRFRVDGAIRPHLTLCRGSRFVYSRSSHAIHPSEAAAAPAAPQAGAGSRSRRRFQAFPCFR